MGHFNLIKSKKVLLKMLLYSLCIWFFAFLLSFIVAKIFLKLPLGIVIIASCFVILTYLLPIQGLLGFGTSEGAWVLVLLYFSFNRDGAIVSGFVLHILTLIFSIILGFYGFISNKLFKENKINT